MTRYLSEPCPVIGFFEDKVLNLSDFGWCPGSSFDLAFAQIGQTRLVAARIISEHRDTYRIYLKTGEADAHVTGHFRHHTEDPLMFPAVGDWVVVEQQQVTQVVRADDSRGRHTTTHRQLLRLPSGALLIDTPGMRELQLWSDGSGLQETFGDIETLAKNCKFRNCQHNREPGCAIQEAIALGTLDLQRLQSYQKLQREQQWIEQRQDIHVRQNTKRRWKQNTKTMRQRNKHFR